MKNRSLGVTLIELMTAIGIVGILIAIAVPGFRAFTIESQATATTNDLVTALSVARSEALRSSTPAIACASADQATCSGATNWASGWIVFADRNGDGAVGANELRQSWSGPGAGVSITATQNRVIYNSLGMGQLPAGVANISFSIVPQGCADNRARSTIVTLAGTIQSARVACPS